MKALILDGQVVQVEAEEFPVAPSLEWVDCPDDIKAGYSYDGAFTAPVKPAPVKPEPTETEILLKALETKTGITEQDKVDAEAALKSDA